MGLEGARLRDKRRWRPEAANKRLGATSKKKEKNGFANEPNIK
jgi:hypothetical protein